MDDETRALLAILHRGGAYGYWWTIEGRQSFWWEVGKMTALPGGRRNVYFGVHPTTAIPERNPRGEPVEPRAVRAQLSYIAALNCLYCEYDAKDFGGDKTAALAAAEAMEPAPSVIIDSGAGYHVYHLFDIPWVLTSDDDREKARRLQAAWVSYAHSDPQVKDLARVLRVPGTKNHKYTPPRPVAFVRADFKRLYTPDTLEGICGHLMEDARLPSAGSTTHRNREADRETRYALGALDREVANVLRAPPHGKHDIIRNAALKLGTFVPRGLLTDDQIIDELARAANLHREDVADTYRAILDGIAYGKQRPREIPKAKNGTHERSAAQPTGLTIYTPRKLLHADELSTLPPSRWLIDNIIPMNKIAQIFGPGGIGKSFLLLDLALSVAQFANVVYVAAEDAEDYEERKNAWCAHHSLSAGGLHFWTEAIDLYDSTNLTLFLDEIEPLRPALLLVDPLANCMAGGDPDTTQGMTQAVEGLHFLRRRTGAALLVSHHSGWSDTHERGSSVLRWASRITMKLMNIDGLLVLKCEKINGARPFADRAFRLVEREEAPVLIPSSKVSMRDAPLTPQQTSILDTLAMRVFNDGATFTQLIEHTGIAKSSLNYVLNKLLQIDSIRREGKQTYLITDDGRERLEQSRSGGDQSSYAHLEEDTELRLNWKINQPMHTAVKRLVQSSSVTTKPSAENEAKNALQNSAPQTDAVQSSSVSVQPQFSPSSVPVQSSGSQFSSVSPPLRGETELPNTELSPNELRVQANGVPADYEPTPDTAAMIARLRQKAEAKESE